MIKAGLHNIFCHLSVNNRIPSEVVLNCEIHVLHVVVFVANRIHLVSRSTYTAIGSLLK